jgi:HEAT repeat protein
MGLFDRFRKESKAPAHDPSLPRWIAALGHSDWQTRKQAAEALGGLGARAEEAVPALEAAIADENGDVCLAASEALSKIRAAAG